MSNFLYPWILFSTVNVLWAELLNRTKLISSSFRKILLGSSGTIAKMLNY